MGLLAGGDRIEGCLLGNGERTGNVDIVTLALNQFCQGIQPGPLDLSDVQSVVDVVSSCNDIPVHPRHPYAGELVFTAFSGSHQDAIKKGFHAQTQRREKGDPVWSIPYLPIDPADLGATYEAVIRVNSQSGKGGVAYLVAQSLGLDLPRRMQVAFYQVIQEVADRTGREMTTDDITRAFTQTYHVPSLALGKNEGSMVLKSFRISDDAPNGVDGDAGVQNGTETPRHVRFNGVVARHGKPQEIEGRGNGPLSALLDAIDAAFGISAHVREYSEHVIDRPGVFAPVAPGNTKTKAQAATYVELVDASAKAADEAQSAAVTNGGGAVRQEGWWGVGIDVDITASTLKAVLSAASNLEAKSAIDIATKAITQA